MQDERNIISKKLASLRLYYMWHYASRRLGLILVSEYPKSGATWYCQMLADYLQLPFPRNTTPKYERSVLHGHYLYNPSFNKIVHQLRDGRDIMVSLYHHMYFGNAIVPEAVIQKYRENAPFKEFNTIQENLPAYIDYMFTRFTIGGRRINWSDFLHSYSNRENVVCVKYENLLQDPAGELEKSISLLSGNDQGLNKERIKQIVEKYSFESVAKRKRGEENKSNFLRKGIAGDWKNYFTKEASQVFDYYAGKELISAGYEQNNNWVNNDFSLSIINRMG